MPAVLLGHGAYRRDGGHLPPVRLKNRYFEADPTNAVDQTALMPRPGLVPFATVGTGPIRGLYRQAGVLGGDWMVVSGGQLWRVSSAGVGSLVGAIAGEGAVEFASDGVNTLIAAGTLYRYDGSALTILATPDAVGVVSVAQINGFFLLQVAGSGRFYWMQPGATTIDALDFATAERAPDLGVAIRVTGDFIALMNTGSTEMWVATGEADAPFQRQAGLLFEKGCVDRRTAINLDNGLFWVAETASEGRVVYRGGQAPLRRISNYGIEEAMRGDAGLSALGFTFDGHAFYALRIDGRGTFLFDISTGSWSEFASYGRANWRVGCAAGAPGGPLLLGDDETGQLWRLDSEAGHDDGAPIERVVTGRIAWPRGVGTVSSLALTAGVGWTDQLDLDPQITLRVARDGFTFSDARSRSLGRRGAFSTRVRFERLGQIMPPGLVVELADSDRAQTRIGSCRYNEDG